MTEPSKVRPYKWQRNTHGGLTLTKWRPPKTYRRADGSEWTVPGNYNQCADVFRAKKGDRWVARWITWNGSNHNWKQGSTLTMREAMRLAQFMVGMQDGS